MERKTKEIKAVYRDTKRRSIYGRRGFMSS